MRAKGLMIGCVGLLLVLSGCVHYGTSTKYSFSGSPLSKPVQECTAALVSMNLPELKPCSAAPPTDRESVLDEIREAGIFESVLDNPSGPADVALTVSVSMGRRLEIEPVTFVIQGIFWLWIENMVLPTIIVQLPASCTIAIRESYSGRAQTHRVNIVDIYGFTTWAVMAADDSRKYVENTTAKHALLKCLRKMCDHFGIPWHPHETEDDSSIEDDY